MATEGRGVGRGGLEVAAEVGVRVVETQKEALCQLAAAGEENLVR